MTLNIVYIGDARDLSGAVGHRENHRIVSFSIGVVNVVRTQAFGIPCAVAVEVPSIVKSAGVGSLDMRGEIYGLRTRAQPVGRQAVSDKSAGVAHGKRGSLRIMLGHRPWISLFHKRNACVI